MKLTLQQMKYVNKVAEAGSLTEAAKQLSVSQAALSTSISQLENELGVELFIRKGRGFRPTEEGIKFLALSHRVLDDVDEIERSFFTREKPETELNISSVPFAVAWRPFVAYLNSMADKSIVSGLESAKPSRVIRDVGSGVKNLGVIYLIPGLVRIFETLFETNNVEFHELANIPTGVFVSADHPLVGLDEVDEETLKPFMGFSLDQYLYLRLVDTQDSYGPVVERAGDELIARGITPIDDLLSKINKTHGYVRWARVGEKACDKTSVRFIPFASGETISFGYIKKTGEPLTEIEEGFISCYKEWLE